VVAGPSRGAVKFGAAFQSFNYLTSDCNPTSVQRLAEPILKPSESSPHHANRRARKENIT